MTVRAAILNLVIEAGATYSLPLAWKSGDGNLVDLTGCTARMMMREDPSSPILFLATTENGFLTLGSNDVEGSNVLLKIDALTTSTFLFDSAAYDMEIVFAGGFVRRLIKGRIRIDPEVTHG